MGKKYTDRTQQRANRRKKHHEEKLAKYDNRGMKDLTPYNAVQMIRTNGKAEIALR